MVSPLHLYSANRHDRIIPSCCQLNTWLSVGLDDCWLDGLELVTWWAKRSGTQLWQFLKTLTFSLC